MENASDRLYIYDYSVPAKLLNQVPLPKVISIYKLDGKWDENQLIVKVNSFTMPGTAYEVNTDTFAVKTIKKSELPDKTFNPDDYIEEQVFYKSKDGTQIPMYIVRKKDTLPSLSQKPK